MDKIQLLAIVVLMTFGRTDTILANDYFPDIKEEIPQEIVDCFIEKTEEEVVIEEEIIVEVDNEEEVIEEIEPNSTSYTIPDYPGMKKWMTYKKFNSNTKQKQLQDLAHTDVFGCRLVDQRYCVALGTHFGTDIGQYVDLILENGAVIPCILADCKAPQHTDSSNIFSNTTHNLCASEFVVDPDALHDECKKRGDMSFLYEEWNSPVETVIVYELNIFNASE